MQTNDLLRSLGSAGAFRNQSGVGPSQTQLSPGLTTSFDELLSKAQGGAMTSKAGVTIAKGANVQLTPEQLQRVGAAADMAEANGASRVLVLVDGHAYRLDVGTRTILGEATQGATAAMPDVDSVVAAPAADGQAPVIPAQIKPPSATPSSLANTGVRQLLEKMAG